MRPAGTVSFRRLFDVAELQQGYFTAKQAKAAGFAENTHPYHVQAGNWIRVHRGIYRLALYPSTDRPDLAMWTLWSMNRREEVEGVFSHQTALRIHELSDVNPARLHLTVPRQFRRTGRIPNILVLHFTDLREDEIQTGQGFRVTRPLRTILDLAQARTVEQDQLRRALRQALDGGLATRAEVKAAWAASEDSSVRDLLEGVL